MRPAKVMDADNVRCPKCARPVRGRLNLTPDGCLVTCGNRLPREERTNGKRECSAKIYLMAGSRGLVAAVPVPPDEYRRIIDLPPDEMRGALEWADYPDFARRALGRAAVAA